MLLSLFSMPAFTIAVNVAVNVAVDVVMLGGIAIAVVIVCC